MDLRGTAMEPEEPAESLRGLGDFIRSSLDALVVEWTERVRKLSPARELSQPVLVDHLPQILARIAAMVDAVHTGAQVQLAEAPKNHAIDRLSRGFDLEEVIKEYGVLRHCILSRWEREVGPTIAVAELRRLDAALDQSIMESVVSFAGARERMLRAVDRISEAALGTAQLDIFLQKSPERRGHVLFRVTPGVIRTTESRRALGDWFGVHWSER
jgi:RsbT co-antagonist protein rsbRD N-terminal domain